MSILVSFADWLINLNGFASLESWYLLNLKFTLFGEWVFIQSNIIFSWRVGIHSGQCLGKVFPESKGAL